VSETAVLQFVNQVRARRSLEPLTSLPRGRWTDSWPRSPVEVALNASVVLGTLRISDLGRINFISPPPVVLHFIEDYRDGRYPQYEPKGTHATPHDDSPD